MKKYVTGMSGFTYIELIISMGLTLMLLAAVFGLLSTSLLSWQTGSSRIEVQQSARIGLDAVAREIKFEAVTIVTGNGQSNTLRFVNRSGDTVEFFQNGNTLSRRLIVNNIPQPSNPIAGSGTVLVNPVFTIGTIASGSTSMYHNKKIISIDITAADGNSTSQLRTTVVPLNS